MSLNLRPLKDIDDVEEFFRGTYLRKFNVGLSENDFYDYLLVHLPWEQDMIMVNITKNSNKTGAGYGGTIPIKSTGSHFVVNKKGLQHTLGKNLLDWYLIEIEK